MKILSREMLALVDRRTMQEEPVSETDLMERASRALSDWLVSYYPPTTRVAVFAGPGNNGGDALVIARMMASLQYPVEVFLPDFGSRRSDACLVNLGRLQDQGLVCIYLLKEGDPLPPAEGYDLVIDGLYGSGLNRPLQGFAAQVIGMINGSGAEIVSIDMPSGLMCDSNPPVDAPIVRATCTLTLGMPKLTLFYRENEPFFGNWEIITFGLSQKAIDEAATACYFLDQDEASSILKRRKRFSHKGSFGHGLLISGSLGKYGAAILAAKGALKAGLGLLTVHLPGSANAILQASVPEAMTSPDQSFDFISGMPDQARYSAIAAGPGLGSGIETCRAIRQLLETCKVPLVLDADALNILSLNRELMAELPPATILTPHPVEFDRLSGSVASSDEERLAKARDFAGKHKVVLVLKGAFTRIIFPDGRVVFNSTGNPGMATAGSGDVLTGILLGLLCQGYSVREAALLGVFLHGRSADLVVEAGSEESLVASEIADNLGNAFASLRWR